MKKQFSLDLRSLSLFRVFLGIILVIEFVLRLPILEAFYTDNGILPRWIHLQKFEYSWDFSLLLLNGTYPYALFITIIGILASLFYIVGWRTRLMNFLMIVVYWSFHNRFYGVMNGGDYLIRNLLFYSFFLPVNAYWSVDSVLEKDQTPEIASFENSYFSSFTFIVFIQALMIYWFTFLFKMHPIWHTDFTAVYFALNLDMFTTMLGEYLSQFLWLTKFLTISALAIEGIGPFFMLIPYKRSQFLLLTVVLFYSLHLGILLTFNIATFPLTCLTLWTIFLPDIVWDFLSKKVKHRGQSLTLFYDVDCGFCRKSTLILKELLFLPSLTIKNNFESREVDQLMKDQKSWVLEYDGKRYTRFSVFLKLIHPDLKFPQFFVDIGDFFYKVISGQRSFWGVLINKVGYSPVDLKNLKLRNLFGYFVIYLVVSVNVAGYVGYDKYSLKDPLPKIVRFLGLNQKWNMFAPFPLRRDGWYVVEGTLLNGKQYDIFHDHDVSFERPRFIQDTYPDARWAKFLNNIRNFDYKKKDVYLLGFGKYLCRQWNTHHEGNDRVDRFDIHFMLEVTPEPGEKPVIEKTTLWNHWCFKKPDNVK